MKKFSLLGTMLVVALTQAGCGTEVKSVPFAASGGEAPVYFGKQEHPPVKAGLGDAARGEVPVYFGKQEHRPVKSHLGDAAYSVRIARKTSDPTEACHLALAEAVAKLRAAARERHANAVIEVSTRFHSTESDSSNDFTCGISPSAAAISVRGQLVVLDAG
ncbi:signal peptidase [Paraburkholderia sp. ZP32-5]|uniref:signal peptidase n=1 Tax=Paraburkholderia sp. ZP32-5 TaxID=2883245 RepID=UPI001F2E1D5A|nr:signal peptidase [Paraburkholderia sp. ZP32-5]